LGIGLGGMLARNLSTPWCFLNPSFYFGHSNALLWDADFSEMGVQMYRHWLLPHMKTANLVLHATDQTFDICPPVLPAQHQYVGPIFWEMPEDDQEALQWNGFPWVLIAVSTSPQPGDLTIVKTALRALESMDFQVLVTLAPGHDKDDLGPIPANVHVTGYTPHSKVLSHCRFVISHAGHGIVMKSMLHGVPMVLVPWGRDQPGVAARAEKMGTAVVVPKPECSARVLTEAIRKILNDPEYLERLQVISCRLRKMDGVTEAVAHIERFLAIR
jgi:MGT family glycosyltransferase